MMAMGKDGCIPRGPRVPQLTNPPHEAKGQAVIASDGIGRLTFPDNDGREFREKKEQKRLDIGHRMML